jgi:hypothetical protein
MTVLQEYLKNKTTELDEWMGHVNNERDNKAAVK